METSNLTSAVEYYKLMGQKNIAELKKYLHSDVEWYGPMATLKGKEAVIEATGNFMNMIESLTVRAKFSAGDQAMLVYDTDVPGIGKGIPCATLINFRDGLIVRFEVFYDGSRFIEKKEEIFS